MIQRIVLLLLAAAVYGLAPSARGQEIPIVQKDQVFRPIGSALQPRDDSLQDSVSQPVPFQLESFDFQAQVGLEPPTSTVAQPAADETKSAAAIPSLIQTSRPFSTQLPAIQQTGFLAGDSPLSREGGDLPPIVSSRMTQDMALPASAPPAPPPSNNKLQIKFQLDQGTNNPPPVPTSGLTSSPQPTLEFTADQPIVEQDSFTWDANQVADQFNSCGFVSCASRYVHADYLFWAYENDVFSAGNFSGVDDYDWTAGWRATVGRRWDCNSGIEATYMGFEPWRANTTQTSIAGNLAANFFPVGGFPAGSVSAFQNDTFLQQVERTRLHSAEINRTGWGWDVVKTQLGFRYIYFDETFQVNALNLANQQGFYQLDTTNYLFGPQLGWELFYDIGYRLSCSVVTKIGGYINIHRGSTVLLNGNAVTLNVTDRDTAFSASGEVGLHLHYQLRPRARLRAGYDLLGLWDVATVAGNFNRFIGPATGINTSNDDTAVFHGAFVGIEFYR